MSPQHFSKSGMEVNEKVDKWVHLIVETTQLPNEQTQQTQNSYKILKFIILKYKEY